MSENYVPPVMYPPTSAEEEDDTFNKIVIIGLVISGLGFLAGLIYGGFVLYQWYKNKNPPPPPLKDGNYKISSVEEKDCMFYNTNYPKNLIPCSPDYSDVYYALAKGEGDIWTIQNKSSNLCIEKGDSDALVYTDCSGKSIQNFKMIQSGSEYQIKHLDSEMCLGSVGKKVKFQDCDSSKEQKFTFKAVSKLTNNIRAVPKTT